MSNVSLTPEQVEQIKAVMIEVRRCEAAVKDAYALRQEVLRELHAAGMRVGELAQLTDVRAQRVSKILDGNAPPRRKRRSPVSAEGSFPAEWVSQSSEEPAAPAEA